MNAAGNANARATATGARPDCAPARRAMAATHPNGTAARAATAAHSLPGAASAMGITLLLLVVQLTCTLSRWSAPTRPPVANHAQLRLDPNFATAAELALLPRIGPALAAAILDYRTRSAQQPAFRTLADLDAVPRIGPETLASIAPYLTFGHATTATNTSAAQRAATAAERAPLAAESQ